MKTIKIKDPEGKVYVVDIYERRTASVSPVPGRKIKEEV